MYFKLKNIDYNVEKCSVSFDINPSDQKLIMFIEIEAKNTDGSVDYELRDVYLYHNNGFQIGGKTLSKLSGKVFAWDKKYNAYREEAGTMCVLEHENLTSGTIEILEVTKETIKLKWSGLANIYWNDEFGENVPFETEVEAKLPPIPKIKVINGMEKSVLKLDKDTVVELLNFEDLLNETERCTQLWRQNDKAAWEKYNATLKIKVVHKGVEYSAEAVYKNSAKKCELIVDENCPKKLEIVNTTIDTVFKEYNLYFSWE